MENIIIVNCPIQRSKDEIFAMAKNDPHLCDAIKSLSAQYAKEGIETFEQHLNIIATERGYYAAFYESDLQHA